jgi:hypothetical protein
LLRAVAIFWLPSLLFLSLANVGGMEKFTAGSEGALPSL